MFPLSFLKDTVTPEKILNTRPSPFKRMPTEKNPTPSNPLLQQSDEHRPVHICNHIGDPIRNTDNNDLTPNSIADKISIKFTKRLGLTDDQENEKDDGINVTKQSFLDRKIPRIEARINPQNIQSFDPTTTPPPIHVSGKCSTCNDEYATFIFCRQSGFIALNYRCIKCDGEIRILWDVLEFPENYSPPKCWFFNIPYP